MARNPIIREPYPEVPTDQERPHGCIDGWVYLGFESEDSEANGEHVEEIERVHCRRCSGAKNL